MTLPQLLAEAAAETVGYQSLIMQAASTAVIATIGFFLRRAINQFDKTIDTFSRRLDRNCRRLRRVERMCESIPMRYGRKRGDNYTKEEPRTTHERPETESR